MPARGRPGTIEIEFEGVDETIRALRKFAPEIENAADDTLRKISEEAESRLEVSLIRNGSVKTASGLKSIQSRHLGENTYGVLGARYLHFVDKGTGPHNPRQGPRFRKWARLEGWEPSALADVIRRKGTRPHPFIDRPLRRVMSAGNVRKRASVELAKAGKRAGL